MTWLDALDRPGFAIPVALQDAQPGMLFLTRIADQFVGNPMVKMGPLVLLLLYGWLRGGGRGPQGGCLASAERVVRGTLAIGAAIVAGRLLQEVLPMRQRPRFALPDLPFPPTEYSIGLDDWSSMPSDHAMLVAAVVMAIAAASKPQAAFAAAWGVLTVCFARVLYGLHYASDVVLGFGLGLALAAVVLRMPLPRLAWGWLERLDARHPRLVLVGLVVLVWSIGEVFLSVRSLIAALRHAARADAPGAALLLGGLGVLVLGLVLGRLALQRIQLPRPRQQG